MWIYTSSGPSVEFFGSMHEIEEKKSYPWSVNRVRKMTVSHMLYLEDVRKNAA